MAGEGSAPKKSPSATPQKESPPGDKTALDVNLQELMRKQAEADREAEQNGGTDPDSEDDEKTEGTG